MLRWGRLLPKRARPLDEFRRRSRRAEHSLQLLMRNKLIIQIITVTIDTSAQAFCDVVYGCPARRCEAEFYLQPTIQDSIKYAGCRAWNSPLHYPLGSR